MHAKDVPPELDMPDLFTRIDHARLRLGETTAVLPQSAELDVTHWNGAVARNRVEFTYCREYGSQSQVSYGSATPAEAAAVRGTHFTLPHGLRMVWKTRTP